MLPTIRLRLVLSHLAVITAGMALSAFLLLSFLQRYFVEAVRNSLVAQARITAQALVPGAQAPGPEVIAPIPQYNAIESTQRGTSNLALQTQNVAVPTNSSREKVDLSYLTDASVQLSSQLDTRIRVLDLQGTVLVDSDGDRGSSVRSDPLVSQGLAGRYGSRIEEGSAGSASTMHVVLPFTVDGQVAGLVYLSQSLKDAAAVLTDVRSRLLLSTAIALVLSGLAGLLLSQAIASPIRRLTGAAEAVALGDLNSRVPVRSSDELGRLSRTFNDMTARLDAARQMQTDFVANVSHELRTPLASIKAMVESLRDGAVDDLEVRDNFLHTVENETDRMTRLVNDLLVLSQVDSDALLLKRQDVDLVALACEVADRLTPQAEARKVSFELVPAPGTPPAGGDPARITQVLLNILSNAVQYSYPDSAVTISVYADGPGRVSLAVRDRGIGIPAQALPHIGERFYRTDKARSRAAGGSGLGLAIARALVEAHGGDLRLESQEGQGTTVTVTLPAATQLDAGARPQLQ